MKAAVQHKVGAPRALAGSGVFDVDGAIEDEETLAQKISVVNKPSRTSVIPVTIPHALVVLKQWVVWRYELDDKGRWTKVPKHSKYTKQNARSDDPTTWSTFDMALDGYNNTPDIDGIGFVPSINDLITGVDLDHCIDDSGKIAPWAQEIINLLDSYTEISPSGHGVRIFIFGKLPGTGRKAGNVEVYDKTRYLTVTGHHISSTPSDIQERQPQLDAFMGKHFKEDAPTDTTYEPGESILTDDEVIENASNAKNKDKFNPLWAGDTSGHASPSEADSALCFHLAYWTRKDPAQMDRLFRASGLYRDKWDEKHGVKTYGQMTIEKAITKCSSTYTQAGEKGLDVDIDLEVRSWPILNQKALYGLAGEVVELATRSSEADPAAVLATFLVWFAAEAGPSPHIWVGDSKHQARLTAAIVGNSSKARKGTSAKPIERIFSQSDNGYLKARTSPGPLSSGEGLIYAVRDEVREWVIDKKTHLGEWTISDPGVPDKRLCVIDEEFGAALSCTKREGNTLSTIIRQAWDHGNIEPLTKTNRIKATKAHINIVTHITNAELQQKLHETEALNGFGNRILWVCARRNGFVSRPQQMPEAEVEKLRNQITEAAITAQSDNLTMRFSESTWTLWDSVYPELSKDHSGLAGVIINRAEAQAVRLSMVYALLDEQTIIEPHHLEAALAFWQYCQESALFIFGGRESDSVADKIIEALRVRDHSSTEISDLFARHISSARLTASLRDLAAAGRVTSYKIPNPKKTGRPIIMYSLVTREISEISEISAGPSGVNSHNSLNSQDEVEV